MFILLSVGCVYGNTVARVNLNHYTLLISYLPTHTICPRSSDPFYLGKLQTSSFFSGPAPKRGVGGEGVKGLASKKKYPFLKVEKKSRNFFVATKLEGGGMRP